MFDALRPRGRLLVWLFPLSMMSELSLGTHGTMKPNLHVASQHSLGSAFDGGDLGRGQAHGLGIRFWKIASKLGLEAISPPRHSALTGSIPSTAMDPGSSPG